MNSKKLFRSLLRSILNNVFFFIMPVIFHKLLQLFWGFSEKKSVHFSLLFGLFFCFQTSFLCMLSSPSILKLSLVFKHPSPKQFCIGISGFLNTHHVINRCVLFSYAYGPLRDPEHKPIMPGKCIVVE